MTGPKLLSEVDAKTRMCPLRGLSLLCLGENCMAWNFEEGGREQVPILPGQIASDGIEILKNKGWKLVTAADGRTVLEEPESNYRLRRRGYCSAFYRGDRP